MNIGLISLGLLLLIAGYSIGINRRVQVITYLKKKRVREGRKVTEIIGSSQFILGAIVITVGGLGFQHGLFVMFCTLLVLLGVFFYLMTRYADE